MVFNYFFLFCTLLLAPLTARPGYETPWGKDASLTLEKIPPIAKEPPKRANLLGESLESVIHFYQREISPLYPARSHFRPTSSRYMLLAIRRHGLLNGYLMGCDRLLRENSDPWVYRTRVIGDKKYQWDPTWKE